jgi:hypothetical protein
LLPDYDAVDLREDALLALIRLYGRDDCVAWWVDYVGVLVEHHQGLPAAALAEGVHGLAQSIQLASIHWNLALLDALHGVLRELERALIGRR